MFTDLLKDSKHSQPIICLQEVKSEVLGWILDFVYNGEVNISQESLSEFIYSAGQLELKGVAGLSRQEQKYIETVSTQSTLIDTPTEETGNEVKPNVKQEYFHESIFQKKTGKLREKIEVSKYLDFEGGVKNLNLIISSMMVMNSGRGRNREKMGTCKECGKVTEEGHLRVHI